MKKILVKILCGYLLIGICAGCGDSSTVSDVSGVDVTSTDAVASSASDQVSSDESVESLPAESGDVTSAAQSVSSETAVQTSSTQNVVSTGNTSSKQQQQAAVPTFLAEQQSRWKGRTFQVLNDPDLKYGALLYPTTHTGTDGGDVMFAKSTEQSPYWSVAQWYSRESLTGVKAKTSGNTTTYSNACKSISIDRKTNGSNPGFTLVCNGYDEYGAVPSEDVYGWTHFGIGQDVRDLVSMGDLESFVLKMNAKMNYQEDKTGGTPASQYGCQFNLCFILRNENDASKDFGKIIWCQVGLYDERYDFPPEYCGIDAGIAESSGEFIYTMSSKNILTKPFGNGETAVIDYDWLPTFKKALSTVKAYGGMSNTAFSDLVVSSFGAGYEMKRGENYSVTLDNIHVEATYTEKAYKNMCPQVGTNYTKGFTDPSDWHISNGDWTFSDGVLTQSKNKMTTYRMSLKGQYYYGDYDIEYEMCSNERYSTVDAWSGISFSKKFMDDDHGVSGEILFTYPSGTIILGKFHAPEEGHHTVGQIEGFELKKYYKHKIEIRGNKGTVYVDGKKILELDSKYIGEGGYVSIISCLGRASFKNFKITVR